MTTQPKTIDTTTTAPTRRDVIAALESQGWSTSTYSDDEGDATSYAWPPTRMDGEPRAAAIRLASRYQRLGLLGDIQTDEDGPHYLILAD
jgi:hypothetical protein